MKVFFDTNIFSASRSYEKVVSTRTIQWGDIELQTEEHLYQRKTDNNPEHQALLDIGDYGRSGIFSAHITRSIKLEMIPQSRFAKDTEADALQGVDVETHADIIDLSGFKTFTLADDLIKIKRSMTEAIGIVKSIPHREMLKVFDALKIDGDFEDLAGRMAIVRKMAEVFDEKHWPDGFHYVSAEHSGGDIFLTCDKKFLNFVRNTVKYKSPCIALSPTELLQNLKTTSH